MDILWTQPPMILRLSALNSELVKLCPNLLDNSQPGCLQFDDRCLACMVAAMNSHARNDCAAQDIHLDNCGRIWVETTRTEISRYIGCPYWMAKHKVDVRAPYWREKSRVSEAFSETRFDQHLDSLRVNICCKSDKR